LSAASAGVAASNVNPTKIARMISSHFVVMKNDSTMMRSRE